MRLSWSIFACSLVWLSSQAGAEDTDNVKAASRLRHRSQGLVSLPIHTLEARSPANNKTFGGGIDSVVLSSDRQSYYTNIKAGNITFRVVLDTASSDLWILASDCKTTSCSTVPRYPLTYQSPTFISLNNNATNFTAHYADGTGVSGFVAAETVELAGMTVANQTFGLITDSNVTLNDQTSGILGLGFPRLSSINNTALNSTPFFSSLAQGAFLEYPLFGVSLTRNSSGSLSLGAIDASVVTNASRIGWNKVTDFPPFSTQNATTASYLQWAIPLSLFAVNGTALTPIPTYANRPSLALFDMQVYSVLIVSRMYAMIDSARLIDADSGQWAIPCDTDVPMTFTFGEKNYTILPSDYIIGVASGNPNLCLSWPMSLPPSSDGIDWQFGSAFLRTVYSIFSFGINGKEPPLIGLYSLRTDVNSTTKQNASDVLSVLSANSATVQTTLPNFLVPTPSFTTPPFAFNTSVAGSVGAIVSSGLANRTYTALFGQKTALSNVSALPTITPPPTVATIITTDAFGDVTTSLSTRPVAQVTLGLPAGWTTGGSAAVQVPLLTTSIVILTTLFVAQSYC
ncbi:hypothetical protein D9619_004251 [Psilocybe cf. subviscida]|uniref:Peptidase A1 domain-containing protein n=1 Tax=Psilocybe cf. subviscida TaxID=2480587 RepID=A0A8H5F7L2_9AGAR|nr:hypothetical protein D9619_004251 [Psilocybe cf. subviscida]